ncbi:hypothetical protein ACJX0J_016633, partial [Zea mays]
MTDAQFRNYRSETLCLQLVVSGMLNSSKAVVVHGRIFNYIVQAISCIFPSTVRLIPYVWWHALMAICFLTH